MDGRQTIGSVNPFEASGEWLRCALHTHSLESDGELPPWAVTSHYLGAGYDVVAITDHWRLTEAPSTDRLITIPAAELSFDLPGAPSGEFLAYGIRDISDDPGGNRENWYVNEVERYEVRTFPDLSAGARWVADQGGVTYVAHPYWSGLDPHVIVEAGPAVAGLEVFNGGCEVECARGDSSMAWDAVLERGRTAYGIATDDAHSPLFDMGSAWTWVRAAERSVEGVLEALRTGMAYGSNGPAIREVRRERASVEVACTPCRAVVLIMERERGVSVTAGERGRRSGRILEASDDGLIRRATIDVPWSDPRYVRVMAVDAWGRKAWTNPI